MRSRAFSIAAAALSLLSPRGAISQPAGGEFRVNTVTTGNQINATVASNDAGFVIVFEAPGPDGSDVFSRRFTWAGAAVGGELMVNTTTTGFAGQASIAQSADSFRVVWQLGTTTFATQLLDAAGAPVGGELQVNTYTTGLRFAAKVAGDRNGAFVVVWHGRGEGDVDGIFARRFGSDGQPVGNEFRVNTHTTGVQQYPAVHLDRAEANPFGFVVVWTGVGADDAAGVFAQRFSPQGSFLGSEFRVNQTVQQFQKFPAVGGSPGSFVIAWATNHVDLTQYDIFTQRFDSAGVPLGAQGALNTDTGFDHIIPAIATDEDGDLLVTWAVLARPPEDFLGIEGRWIESTGTPSGVEFRVNTYTTRNQSGPAVAARKPGHFVVTWRSSLQDGDSYGVYGQRFNRAGDVNGDGVVSVSDILYLINNLFAGGPAPFGGPGDVDGNSLTNVSDILYLINFLFAGGPAPV